MNDQRLRLDLAALAEEVTPVDLRDRALRTSRRLGVQRAVATSAAVVVVLLGAATGTAFAILPNRGTAVTPAVTPTVTASPSPTSPAASASSEPTATATFGTLFYVPNASSSGDVASWQPGGSPKKRLTIDGSPAVNSASVSPDGRELAWVDPIGTLVVANVDGPNPRQFNTDVDPYCVTPTWAPDSRRLLFRANDATGGPGRYGVLDTANGRVKWWTAQPDACHALWSADGKIIAMNSAAGVSLYDTDGNRRRSVPGLGVGSAWRSNHVASLAPDASRIALFRVRTGEDEGDVGRFLRVNGVLDTRTGKEVGLPLGGRELRQVFFQPDGSLVVRVRSGNRYTLILVDKAGKKVAEKPEPSSLASMQIIAAVD